MVTRVHLLGAHPQLPFSVVDQYWYYEGKRWVASLAYYAHDLWGLVWELYFKGLEPSRFDSFEEAEEELVSEFGPITETRDEPYPAAESLRDNPR